MGAFDGLKLTTDDHESVALFTAAHTTPHHTIKNVTCKDAAILHLFDLDIIYSLLLLSRIVLLMC